MNPGLPARRGARAVALLVSLAGLVWTLSKVDLGGLGQALRRAHWNWLAMAFVLFGICLVSAAWRWHLVLRVTRLNVHGHATFRTALIGHFFNSLLFGPIGGDIAKSILYTRLYGFEQPEVLAASYFDRVVGGTGNAIFLGGCLAVAAAQGYLARARWHVLPVSASGLFLLGAVFLGLCFLAWRRLPRDSAVIKTMESFWQTVTALARKPRSASKAVAAGVFSQMTYSGVLALALQSVCRQHIHWTSVFWAFPLVSFIANIPITVSGAGLREGASMLVLGYCGIRKEDAVAAALLTLAVYLSWALVGAAVWWREERIIAALPPRPPVQTISAVIPTWNEAGTLAENVRRLRSFPEVIQIIVSDGGSRDGTIDLARRLACEVVQAPKSRGRQMRAGSQPARGDAVWFLHADTLPEPGANLALLNCLRDPTVVGGGFWKQFRPFKWLLAGSKARCWLRLVCFRRVLGDQALFVRRQVLREIGGVPDLPLMEEFELCRRLRRAGRLALAGSTVTTSTRRFVRLGVSRAYLRMARLTLLYYLGTPPEKLVEMYEREPQVTGAQAPQNPPHRQKE